MLSDKISEDLKLTGLVQKLVARFEAGNIVNTISDQTEVSSLLRFVTGSVCVPQRLTHANLSLLQPERTPTPLARLPQSHP